MKNEIQPLKFFIDDYYGFVNRPETRVTIYLFQNEACITLSNELGSSTYCRGNTNLIFREYIKNWNECPLDIQIGIIENDKGIYEDIDGDFIYTGQYIVGKYAKKEE